jgi:hypothetical protein
MNLVILSLELLIMLGKSKLNAPSRGDMLICGLGVVLMIKLVLSSVILREQRHRLEAGDGRGKAGSLTNRR